MNERFINQSDRTQCGCDTNFREAVCIHTDKVYDSCRERRCSRQIFPVYCEVEGVSAVIWGTQICYRADKRFQNCVFFRRA